MTCPSKTPQQIYDHEYYMRNRERIRARRREYWHDFQKKGLRKPRTRKPRSIRDHERYMEKRDEILEKQRAYYRAHSDYYKEKSRKWYMKKREEILRL